MAAVVQRLERGIVVPDVEGSIPSSRPSTKKRKAILNWIAFRLSVHAARDLTKSNHAAQFLLSECPARMRDLNGRLR